MAKNYEDLGRTILEKVGSKDNVTGLRHCITRLRFNLKDESLADTEGLEKTPGVISVVKSADQYQVVIGNEVSEVYDAVLDLMDGAPTQSLAASEEKKGFATWLMDLLSGVFQPFIMILAGAGLIKGIVAVMGILGLNAENSGLYFLLNVAGDGFFQFLPIMVAVTAAKKFRMNEFIALGITAALLHPNISALIGKGAIGAIFPGTDFESGFFHHVAGLPFLLPKGGYYSSIIPILFAVWFGSVVEKFIRPKLPSVVRSFLTPFLTFLISIPIVFLIIGPIANLLSALVGWIFMRIQSFSSLLYGGLLAASWQILVIFGLHWGLVPIGLIQLSQTGQSSILGISMIGTFGVLGVLLALAIKSKEVRVKELATASAPSCLFGVSEPAIYGLMMPLKRSFAYAILGNFVAGAVAGVLGATSYRAGGLGIFSLFRYIPDDGGLTLNFWAMVIAFTLATGIGFLLQMLLPVERLNPEEAKAPGADPEDAKAAANAETAVTSTAKAGEVFSPLDGQLIPLQEVKDPVFSKGVMGPGIAIEPTSETVFAPADGRIITVFPTGHALGLAMDNGAELLIHIGLDTVGLEGKGFEKLIAEGDQVKKGDPLIRFDASVIKEAGLAATTLVIVTNAEAFTEILPQPAGPVSLGDLVLSMH